MSHMHTHTQAQQPQQPQLAVAAAAAAAGCPPPPPPAAPEADEAEYAWLPLDCIKPFEAGQGAGPEGGAATGDEALQVRWRRFGRGHESCIPAGAHLFCHASVLTDTKCRTKTNQQ
eukprot:217021-Pelagomonas_calceolata.AAC.2